MNLAATKYCTFEVVRPKEGKLANGRQDTQHNNTLPNDTQHNGSVFMLNVIYADCVYAVLQTKP